MNNIEIKKILHPLTIPYLFIGCFLLSFLTQFWMLTPQLENPLKTIALKYYGVEVKGKLTGFSYDRGWTSYKFEMGNTSYEYEYSAYGRFPESINDSELLGNFEDNNQPVFLNITFFKYLPTWNKPSDYIDSNFWVVFKIIFKLILILGTIYYYNEKLFPNKNN